MYPKTIIFTGLVCLLISGCDKKCESPAPANAEITEPAKTPEKPERVKIGKALAGAEAVTVKDLLADPEKYKDKIVRVSGKVEDFCHHKLAWFSVTATDSPGMVRVFTVPRFKVPKDCKGKQAVAEGKVEVIEIAAEHVAHYSKEHKFLAGVKVEEGKPLKRPIVRAFGAELW
jgi:hypothetical protein